MRSIPFFTSKISIFAPDQVAIRWLLDKGNVPSVIIGVKNMKQLRDNLGSISFKLTDEDIEKLDEASEIPPPYPYEMINRMNLQRTA